MTPTQEQIEHLVTNGLGYDGVNPAYRKERKDRAGLYMRFLGCDETDVGLHLHLAGMEGIAPEQIPEVMKQLGFEPLQNYDPNKPGEVADIERMAKDLEARGVRTARAPTVVEGEQFELMTLYADKDAF